MKKTQTAARSCLSPLEHNHNLDLQERFDLSVLSCGGKASVGMDEEFLGVQVHVRRVHTSGLILKQNLE